MSVQLYMDVHVPAPITRALTRRGVDIRTAQVDGTTEMEDDLLLDRATALNRALFTRDQDLLAEANAHGVNGGFGEAGPGGDAGVVAVGADPRASC